MYKLNGFVYNVVKTWIFEGEGPLDNRNGRKCYELESESKRFNLKCFEEDLDQLSLA